MRYFEIYKGKVRRELSLEMAPTKGFKVGSYQDPDPKYNKLEQYVEWIQEYDPIKKLVHLTWKVHPRNEQKIFEAKKQIVETRIEEGLQNHLNSTIEYNGYTFSATQKTLEAMHSAYLVAISDSTYFCNWKADEGFITLNATQVIDVYRIIQERTFAIHKKRDDLLDALNIATIETIDELYYARNDLYEGVL